MARAPRRHDRASEPSTPLAIDRRLRPVWSLGLQLTVVGVLFLAVWWLTTVAVRLDQVGIPAAAQETAASVFPGTTTLPAPAVETTGDWVVQDVAGQTFLATRTAGATLTIPFYGTTLAVTARTGPDAGRVYVSVDDSPARGLPVDERGSYVDLDAPRASTREIELTSGLRPGRHLAVLVNGSDGELAVQAVIVTNRPALGWVLALAFTATVGLLYLTVRRFWSSFAVTRGWLQTAYQPDLGHADALR